MRTYVALGFTQFTLGVNGPEWEVGSAVEQWLSWRDEQNASRASTAVARLLRRVDVRDSGSPPVAGHAAPSTSRIDSLPDASAASSTGNALRR